MARISTFDDWIDLLKEWQHDIGLDRELIERFMPGYEFEAKYGELPTPEIYFGDFKGERRWEKVREIPDQRMRDAVLNMVVYQGDTEFASNEQQRFLVNNAPSEYDLASLVRIMVEETRHGYQMCHLLVNHFGSEGKIEAQKMLERRAFGKKNRLLNAFNDDVTHWLDFFAYTNFMDRDGKFQLTMLSHSSFAPLAASMGPMLQRRIVPHGHRHHGAAPHRQGRRHSGRRCSRSTTTSGSRARSISSEPIIRVRRSGRTRGASKAASTRTRPATPSTRNTSTSARAGSSTTKSRRRSRASTKSIRARRSSTFPTCASTARSATTPASATRSTAASSPKTSGTAYAPTVLPTPADDAVLKELFQKPQLDRTERQPSDTEHDSMSSNGPQRRRPSGARSARSTASASSTIGKTATSAFIEMDDPPANTYTHEMMRQLDEAILDARSIRTSK